jgi:hypothetical protein
MVIEATPSQVEAFDHEWGYHILPDGRGVKFSFHEATHTYRVEDPWDHHCFDVPSCTQILQNAGLRPNLEDVPWRIVERKQKIGMFTHKAAHLHQLGELDYDSLDPQVAPYFSGYLAFLKDSGFTVKYTERRVIGYYGGLWWGGTIDVEGDWQRCPWIVDLKCTAEDHVSFAYQTAGYAATLPKPLTPPFRYRRGTLRLRPDGTYVTPREHTDSQDVDVFLNALRLEWTKRRRKL